MMLRNIGLRGYTRKNKFFQIAHPFFYGFITLAHVAKGASQYDVFSAIGTSTRNRFYVIDVIFAQGLIAPIAFTLLDFILALYITCCKVSTVLFNLIMPYPETGILLCPMCSSVNSPLFSNMLSIGLSVHESSPLYFVSILESPFFALDLFAQFAPDIQTIWFSLVSIKMPRCSRILLMANGTLFQYFFIENRRRFHVSFVNSFCTALVDANTTCTRESVYGFWSWRKMSLIKRFYLFAFRTNFCFWKDDMAFGLRSRGFLDGLSLHALSTNTVVPTSNGLKFVEELCLIAHQANFLSGILQSFFRMLARITLSHILASAFFALRNKPTNMLFAWVEELSSSGEGLFAISALQQGIIHDDLNCLSFSALFSCCQSGKATTFLHPMISQMLGNITDYTFFSNQRKAEE